jgi:cyclohexanone monooxygenase
MANPITGLTPKVLDFDPESLEKKYSQERKKRLRNDGNKQYLDTEGDPKLLNLDVDPKFRREPIDGDVGTLIVGGGFGGILAAVRLMEREYKDVFIIEKGSELGGTWYWNQYPGEYWLERWLQYVLTVS